MSVALILAAAAAAAGAGPAEPWASAPLSAPPAVVLQAAAAAARDARDAHVFVLHEEGQYSIAADGSVRRRYHQAYRILRAGFDEGWGRLETEWAPWLGDRPVLRARVVLADGTTRLLDGRTIVETPARESSPDTYGDRRILRAPIPGVAVGSVVEVEIVSQVRGPLDGAGTERRFYFGSDVPMRRVRLSIDVAEGVPLHVAAHGLVGVRAQRKHEGGRERVVFEAGPLAALDAIERDLPVDAPGTPAVWFSTGKSWQDVARRYDAVTESVLRGSDFSAEARVLGGRGLPTIEIARRASASLGARVRYSGIELGDGSFVPRPPRETLQKGFGDCKDQALLLAALLRAAGVPARLALVSTGSLDPSLPAIDVFDHLIVVVPGKAPLWIDPTARSGATGQLPVPVQGRPALVLDPRTTALVNTPRSTARENRTVETRELFLAEQGAAHVVETTEWHGAFAAHHRGDYQRAQQKQLDEHFRDYMKDEYEATGLDRLELQHLQDPEQPLRLRLESKAAGRAFTGLDDAGAWVRAADLLEMLPEGLRKKEPGEKRRRQDYSVDFPFLVERRYRIVPPEGFAPRALPQDLSIALGPARLERRSSLDRAGAALVNLSLELDRDRLTPSELLALRAAVLAHDEDQAVFVAFDQVGESHLNAGRIREALRIFEAYVARHPQSALGHTHLARGLLEAGLGRAARAESARAMQLGGGDVDVGFTHARVLSHDLFGRPYAEGADTKGAEQRYRALKREHPESVPVRQNLAILLEHNARGERYGSGARLTEAIAEYRELRDQLGDHSLDGNLMAALFFAGRSAEVVKLASTIPDGAVNGQVLVAALAMERGHGVALERALKLVPDGEARATLLEHAKDLLVHVRRYAEAAALAEDAARASASRAAAYRTQAELLRRLRKGKTPTGPIRDPRALIERMFRSVVAEDKASLTALVADAAQAASLREVFDQMRTVRRLLERKGLPPEVVADFVQILDLDSEGNDALGYRLALHSPAGDRTRLPAYAVRKGRELRLVELPLEPQRRAEAREWPAARHWLEWARDTMSSRFAAASGFGRLWLEPSEDPRRIELAAAALAFATVGFERALPTVAACKLEGEREACDRALAFGYARMGRPADALRTIVELRKRGEVPAPLLSVEIDALFALRRLDEAASVIDAWQRRAPADPNAIRQRARLYKRRGQLELAATQYQRLADAGQATARDLNELAWYRSCIGKATERDVVLARKALQETRRGDANILHTLATLLAETGKPEEARELLHEQIDVRGGPSEGTWYTLGRIAESYHLPAVALDTYRSIAPPRAGAPVDSINVLAERAIRRLGGAAPRDRTTPAGPSRGAAP